MDKRRHFAQWGPHGTRVRTGAVNWGKPLRWNRNAGLSGVCGKVFCASLSDVFEDWKGDIIDHKGNCLHAAWSTPESPSKMTMDCVRQDLFRIIDKTANLYWLLLTKRIENVRKMWPMKKDVRPIFPGMPGGLGEPRECMVSNAHRDNAWLGTSVSNQETFDAQFEELAKCRNLSPVLFLSIEPLLDQIDLGLIGTMPKDISRAYLPVYRFIDWVIVGCESGLQRRPCDLRWIRSIVEQCKDVGVPCFVKQIEVNGCVTTDINMFPADLQVRQWPEGIDG